MWHLVPGDPDARRGRVRPGKRDLEKEAEKPGQRVKYGARLEPIQARDPVMLRYVEWKPGAVAVAERSSTEKQPHGDKRQTGWIGQQGLFGNNTDWKCQSSNVVARRIDIMN
ncbi:unnamed protein product [Fusarium graminearum]|uniref:Uncharacterized protein n=1 Tax=Gibberella zeae TaxID=5518 RepID=A0A679PIF0_GIBZA|nr:hypothetical protein FG05_12897 [Fusarium graminearum]CAF3491929.1 unnamed protein product [Fusarium graminearum]CAF3554542.1 unnamed protein product [Fusarium graminearum]CZS85037.1 unnamed protein product [Fusarium graminearum]